jgi:hypothetical protein
LNSYCNVDSWPINHKDHHKEDGSNGTFEFVVRLPIAQLVNVCHLLRKLCSKAVKCFQTSNVTDLPYYRRCVHKWLWDDHGAWFNSQMNPLLDNWCSFTTTNSKQKIHFFYRISFELVFQSEKTQCLCETKTGLSLLDRWKCARRRFLVAFETKITKVMMQMK